jgi:hypothetical protein
MPGLIVVIPCRTHARRTGCRGQGPAGGEKITAPSIRAGTQRRMRERKSNNLAKLFIEEKRKDVGGQQKGNVAYSHIGDSLRRLTSVDVRSKRNCFESRKLFIEEKRKDVGETVGSEESTSLISHKDVGVGGLHAGNYYIGGEFEIQRSLTHKKKLDT